MLSPLHSVLKDHSKKLDIVELRSLLLLKDATNSKTGAYLKFPSLEKESYRRQNNKNQARSSLLQKSVSLDLTQETTKKLVKEFQKQKTKKYTKKEKFDDSMTRKNRFDHYRNYIEAINYVGKDQKYQLNTLDVAKTIQVRKSQMPSIRVEKKAYHKKNGSANYNSIVYDETFVRVKSPGALRSKIQTSRVIVNCIKDIQCMQLQSQSMQLYENRNKAITITPVPEVVHRASVKSKKQKILSKFLKPEVCECKMIFTPWKGEDQDLQFYLNQQIQQF